MLAHAWKGPPRYWSYLATKQIVEIALPFSTNKQTNNNSNNNNNKTTKKQQSKVISEIFDMCLPEQDDYEAKKAHGYLAGAVAEFEKFKDEVIVLALKKLVSENDDDEEYDKHHSNTEILLLTYFACEP